jgi:PleD family two-component response regulator
LPDTDADAALAFVKRLGRELKLTLAMEFQGHISASFGVETTTGTHVTSETALMEAATRALETAKAAGKDQAVHARDLNS